MSVSTRLIVRQFAQPPERFTDFLRLLSQRHQLDSFQSRQRLLGRSLAQFAQGARSELEKISATLTEAGCLHWLVEPHKVSFSPTRIYGLKIDAQRILFECGDQEVVFPAGANVLAVLADLSGTLADKLLSQILASNAYRGRDATHHQGQEQVVHGILQGQPVLDFYLLDEKKNTTAAVRVFPGRFNPAGMGTAATLSSRKNLEVLLQLVKERAGNLQLHTDLGLAMLPGCQLRRADKDDPEALRHNLNSLTRYGWLMADLWRQGSVQGRPDQPGDQAAEQTLLGTLLAGPLAAAGEVDSALNPLVQEFTGVLTDNGLDSARRQGSQQVIAADTGVLPPPPPIAPARWKPGQIWSALVFAGGCLALVALVDPDRSDLIDQIAYHSFASGGAPFLAAVLAFWYAFYNLRIKRKMENTPTSRIRSVAMGMVEVKGSAQRKYALVAPMSHTPCVYYRLTRYRKDKNNRWKVISVTGSDNAPFFLVDDTGKIEIDPAGGQVRTRTRQEGVPGQVGLTRYGSDSTEKWVEDTIVEGTLLYVLGFASVKQEQGGTMREQVQEALRDLKGDSERLKEFDLNGDGEICVDEWDIARARTEERVLHQRMTAKQQRRRQEEHIVIGRKKGRPLIIAETHSETHLAGKYRNAAVALFLLSAGLTVLAIYLLESYSS